MSMIKHNQCVLFQAAAQRDTAQHVTHTHMHFTAVRHIATQSDVIQHNTEAELSHASLVVHQVCFSRAAISSMSASLSPHAIPAGTLPPFEVAKAYAFHVVLAHIEKHTGMPTSDLLGEDKADFIPLARSLAEVGKGGWGQRGRLALDMECSICAWPTAEAEST